MRLAVPSIPRCEHARDQILVEVIDVLGFEFARPHEIQAVAVIGLGIVGTLTVLLLTPTHTSRAIVDVAVLGQFVACAFAEAAERS
jgi:hypothetical protein